MRYLSGFWAHELVQFRNIFFRYLVATVVFVLWGGISILLKFNLGWGNRISFFLPFIAALVSAHYLAGRLDSFSFNVLPKIVLEGPLVSLPTSIQFFPSAQQSFALLAHKHYQVYGEEQLGMVSGHVMTHQLATSASLQSYAISRNS